MQIETIIGEALLARLGALVLTPALPIAWENDPFTKPGNGSYLAAKLFPSPTRQATLGETGSNRHIGFLQVNVCAPQSQGNRTAREIAGQVIAHFKRGTDLTREGVIVTIDGPPYLMSAFNDERNANRYTVPVTIPYRADTANP